MRPNITFHDMKMEIPNETGGENVYYYGEIIYITCNSPCCEVHFIDGERYTAIATLKYLEEMLPDGFFRCNNQTIINICYYRKYSTGPGACVTMENGPEIPLSQRRIPDFKKRKTELPRISPPCGRRCYTCSKEDCSGRRAFCRRSKTGNCECKNICT